MRAIILAAGTGTRLSPLTDACPKCLVPIGGQTLVDRQIEALRSVDVEDIVLVVGYEADQVRDHFGAAVRYIENPDYLTTNSIYSLYLAGAAMDVDTFLFNCDILFHAGILQRMLNSGYPNVVAVDGRVERVAGEMNVVLDTEARVGGISKALDPQACQAQSVQLVKFDVSGARAVRAEVERLIQLAQREVFPTSAYGPLIQAGLLYAVEVGDLPWTEVDSLEDYERAVEQVLPRLSEV